MNALRGYWVRDLLDASDTETPRCDSVKTLQTAMASFARGKVLHCGRPAGRHRLHQSIAGVQWEQGDRPVRAPA